MKRIVTLLTLLLLTTAIFAQKGKVTSALSYKESGDLKKAWETIEETIDSENKRSKSSIEWPRTWEARGEILHAIYREDKTDIVEDALFKALESYKKAIELDEKERYLKSIKVDLTFLQTDFSNYGINAYNKEDFETSYKAFEKYLEISDMPLMAPDNGIQVADSAIIFNTGLTAKKAEKYETAIKYFKRSAELGYNGADCYYYIIESYKAIGDSVKLFETLNEGLTKYPDNESILVEKINYYLDQGNQNDAIEYLDKAIAKNPENATYYSAKGSALDLIGRQDEAIEIYKKAIEIDSNLNTPHYNLGVIFYNRGVDVMNEANELPPNAVKEYDEKIAEGTEHLKIALPYMEKAYELDSTNFSIMESLKVIYYRLQMNDKSEEMSNKIKGLTK